MLIAICKKFIALPIIINSFLECVFVSLRLVSTDLIIGVFYRPPDMNSTFESEFNRVVVEVCTRFPNAVLVFFGDFNYPNIEWSTLSVSSTDTQAQEFLNSCLDFSLCQLIEKPTRCSTTCANILDLLLTSHSDLFTDIGHLDGLSDHDIITRNLICSLNERRVTNKHIRCYNRANFDEISAKLSSFTGEFLDTHLSRSMEDNWNLFKNALSNLIDQYIPVITIKTSNVAPWFNNQLRRLNNKKSDCSE